LTPQGRPYIVSGFYSKEGNCLAKGKVKSSPASNQDVEFEVTSGPKGLQAMNVVKL
jgi:hypothetical protein